MMTILKTTTKDELRIELLKYGVEFSNTKFGKIKRQELIDQLMGLERQSINTVAGNDLLPIDAYDHLVESNNGGDVNMENNKPVVTVETLMSDLFNVASDVLGVTKLVGTQVKKSEAAVKNHVTDSSRIVVAELSKKIDELAAIVTGNAQTVNYTNVMNPAQPHGQYNKKASELKPLGYVVDAKTGQQVPYFGVCKSCGMKIRSAKVVEFSTERYGQCLCYAHQSPNATTTFQSANPVNNNVVDNSITFHACDYCGKEVKYKDVNTFKTLSARAKELNLKPIAHIACWKAAKASNENVQQYMDNQATQSMISTDAANEIGNMFETTQQPQQETPIIESNNAWVSAPIDNNDNNQAY